jgi:hypothetical protein
MLGYIFFNQTLKSRSFSCSSYVNNLQIVYVIYKARNEVIACDVMAVYDSDKAYICFASETRCVVKTQMPPQAAKFSNAIFSVHSKLKGNSCQKSLNNNQITT